MDGKVIPLPDPRSAGPPKSTRPRPDPRPDPRRGPGTGRGPGEAIGRLAAASGHEFNNLLTVIQGNASFLLSRVEDPEARKDLEEITEACERGKAFTTRLLQLSPRAWRTHQTVEISSFLRSLDPGRWISGEVVFLKELPPYPCAVEVHPDDLAEAIRALVLNAHQAVNSQGSVGSIRLRVEFIPGESLNGKSTPDWIHLEVADNGPGMDEDTAARATEPFFSTRRDPPGAGLGLSIAFGVIHQSGGSMRIDTASGWGTRVHAWLPAAPRIRGVPVGSS